jgi:hypothetical protein
MRTCAALAVVVGIAAPAAAGPEPDDSLDLPGAMLIGGDVMIVAGFAGGVAMIALAAPAPPDEDAADGNEIAGNLVFWAPLAYVAIGPYVHARTGHTDHAVVSGALRVGLPIIGAELGYVFDLDDETTGMLAATGAATAIVIDWLTVRDAPARDASPTISPYVVPVAGGAVAGLGGTL